MLSVTDFVPKGIISGVRVQAGLYLDILDADRSPNAVSAVHAGTSQVDFEVELPATCSLSTRRSFDHHGKGNDNFVKKEFRKMKKVVSLIDLKEMKTRNDCEIACDCVERANVVLYVGLCKEIFARKHTATHKPTFAPPPPPPPHSDLDDTHTHTPTRSLIAMEPPGLL